VSLRYTGKADEDPGSSQNCSVANDTDSDPYGSRNITVGLSARML